MIPCDTCATATISAPSRPDQPRTLSNAVETICQEPLPRPRIWSVELGVTMTWTSMRLAGNNPLARATVSAASTLKTFTRTRSAMTIEFFLASSGLNFTSHDREWTSLNFRTRIFENVKAAFDTVGHIDQVIRIDIKVIEHGRLLSLRWRW